MKRNDKLAKQVGYQGQQEEHLTPVSQPAVWCLNPDFQVRWGPDPVYQ